MALDLPGAANSTQSYALFNPLDLYQTEVYDKLIKKAPGMSSLGWLKTLKGRMGKRRTNRHQYSFYEEGQFMRAKATIQNIAANGGNFDITLSPGDHTDIGGAGVSSFPVKNMAVQFQDGKTTGFVVSITRTPGAHVLLVKKWNPQQDIASVALVGTTMVFFSNAQPEESTQTESRVPQFTKVTNYVQEIREGFKVTDFEMQNISWFSTEAGKKYLWFKGQQDTFERFEFQREAAALFTPQASGLTDAAGASVGSMYGLYPQARDFGTTLEYYNRPDGVAFDELCYAAENNYGETKYIVGHAINLMVGLKNYLVQFAANGTGNISFSPFDGGQSQAIKLDFKSYSVGAFEFYFQNWNIFSHRDSFGANGMPHRHSAIIMPAGYGRDTDPERGQRPNETPEYQPYIQLVTPNWGFNPNPNIDKGDYLMWATGALAQGGPTSDVLNSYIHMVYYGGLEIRCRNKFLVWDKA